MRILNYGSLNIDYVYKMEHFVKSGETISSIDLSIFDGGKGLNQSIALARAGANVYHAGKIGIDGENLRKTLNESGVHTQYIRSVEGTSGHAIIQVVPEGENCIILHPGTNRQITVEEIQTTLDDFGEGDWLLLQNEVNNLNDLIHIAASKKMIIALNPAPMDNLIKTLPLHLVDYLIVNEVEGEGLTHEQEPQKILDKMLENYPDMVVVLTLGAKGVQFANKKIIHQLQATPGIDVLDTTAAGDTFIGYFVAGVMDGLSHENALLQAKKASEICITREGAAPSIPTIDELKL